MQRGLYVALLSLDESNTSVSLTTFLAFSLLTCTNLQRRLLDLVHLRLAHLPVVLGLIYILFSHTGNFLVLTKFLVAPFAVCVRPTELLLPILPFYLQIARHLTVCRDKYR